MNEYIFSYGTLQKDEVQMKLFGRVLKAYKDTLKGYKSCPIEIKDKAFLLKGEQKHQQIATISNGTNDSIEGTVFEISEKELLLADSYEPDDYKRIKVKLESGKEAWIYAAKIN